MEDDMESWADTTQTGGTMLDTKTVKSGPTWTEDIRELVHSAKYPDLLTHDFVIIRGEPLSSDALGHFHAYITDYRRQHGVTTALYILYLRDGETLETVSEREMNAAGWYAKQTDDTAQGHDMRTPAERAYDETYGRT